MRRAPLVFATLLVVLVALGIMAAVLGRGGGDASRGAALRAQEKGPTLVLQGVDLTEIRPGGTDLRLRSDRASYSILAHHLSAEAVTVALKAPAGEIVVTAPLAAWDMDSGIVRLPQGGEAAGGGGWAASVPEARLDLSARELTASAASITGPGVAVEGLRFVWRWKDGTMSMDEARGRVVPGQAGGRHG